jgi:hypothetical protein
MSSHRLLVEIDSSRPIFFSPSRSIAETITAKRLYDVNAAHEEAHRHAIGIRPAIPREFAKNKRRL